MPDVADRLAIHELVHLHGHLVDTGAFDRLGELFTPDVAYDVSALGGGVIVGFDAFRDASLALGDGNPVAHHTTNVLITGTDGDDVLVRSMGLGVRPDGTCGSVTYEDRVRRTAAGWRIARRVVLPRHLPLHS